MRKLQSSKYSLNSAAWVRAELDITRYEVKYHDIMYDYYDSLEETTKASKQRRLMEQAVGKIMRLEVVMLTSTT